ncbi:hypothetical protein BDB00DRAFT_635986 [Zychaea mexicana]|uniref:uncharacterized protein n=1 Tax=Zychaea mexicana TaxID=64656 RepID=UPI0022FF435F|nr:uncharacterized protein BDB00DRAFT_635986 [Zychaea mexicana]KAI9489163.1 hypothetical protein BDB00DRAFT_635986 [Zychaea mexicana]
MGFFDEFASRNFSLYAQWLGLISLICNNPIFAIIGWVFAFVLVFVEIPLCTKFCPTSPKFDNFVAKFENSYLRGAMYLIMAIVMFLSTLINETALIAPAVTLLLTFISYAIAGLKQQPHASSKMLGGTGVDNVV